MFLLIALALLASVAVFAAIRTVVTDGYRQIPARPEQREVASANR